MLLSRAFKHVSFLFFYHCEVKVSCGALQQPISILCRLRIGYKIISTQRRPIKESCADAKTFSSESSLRANVVINVIPNSWKKELKEKSKGFALRQTCFASPRCCFNKRCEQLVCVLCLIDGNQPSFVNMKWFGAGLQQRYIILK